MIQMRWEIDGVKVPDGQKEIVKPIKGQDIYLTTARHFAQKHNVPLESVSLRFKEIRKGAN